MAVERRVVVMILVMVMVVVVEVKKVVEAVLITDGEVYIVVQHIGMKKVGSISSTCSNNR